MALATPSPSLATQTPSELTHAAHRADPGPVVDRFRDHAQIGHELPVETLDLASSAGLTEFPSSGSTAVRAFHHPTVVAFLEPATSFATLKES